MRIGKNEKSRPLRIGIDLRVLSQERFSGITSYVENLVPRLFDCGQQFEWVLFAASESDLRFEIGRPNVTLRTPRLVRHADFWKLCGVGIESWKERLDLLFVPVARAPVVKACPLVVFQHDLGFIRLPDFLAEGTLLRTRAMVRYAAWFADRILVASEFMRGELRSSLGVPFERVAITPLGVRREISGASAGDAQDGLVLARYGIRVPYVLYLGVLQPRKNLLRLMEASTHWRKADPTLQLVLAGREGWKAGEIFHAARQFVASQVCLPGAIAPEDLAVVYRNAECFVLPSLYEGFGIPVIEAMACATPVVLSDCGALPEVGGEAALYFAPENSLEIAERVCQIRSSPDLRAKLREAGLQRASRFTWEACAARTVAVFQSLAVPDAAAGREQVA